MINSTTAAGAARSAVGVATIFGKRRHFGCLRVAAVAAVPSQPGSEFTAATAIHPWEAVMRRSLTQPESRLGLIDINGGDHRRH
jgi:hypothetical protein